MDVIYPNQAETAGVGLGGHMGTEGEVGGEGGPLICRPAV